MGFRHEGGRQQACSGALFRHALFRQRQADVAVDEAVADAVGERRTDDSTRAITAATGGPGLLLLACGPSAITVVVVT